MAADHLVLPGDQVAGTELGGERERRPHLAQKPSVGPGWPSGTAHRVPALAAEALALGDLRFDEHHRRGIPVRHRRHLDQAGAEVAAPRRAVMPVRPAGRGGATAEVGVVGVGWVGRPTRVALASGAGCEPALVAVAVDDLPGRGNLVVGSASSVLRRRGRGERPAGRPRPLGAPRPDRTVRRRADRWPADRARRGRRPRRGRGPAPPPDSRGGDRGARRARRARSR